MRDYSYVPAPNPENFWPFEKGKAIMLGFFNEKDVEFRVDTILKNCILGTQYFGNEIVNGTLHLNEPCCILQESTGQPLVTLVLRRIEEKKAFIQVVASPAAKQVSRDSILGKKLLHQ